VISTINELERRVEDITTPIDVAIIRCIVNGPGEAKEAEIGLTGASPSNLVYTDGKPDHKVNNENLVDHLEKVIRQRVADKQKAEAAKQHLIAKSS
jgi:(E)-4-hydroxy-3-methylbut-2-enyl-diphosphate synthase